MRNPRKHYGFSPDLSVILWIFSKVLRVLCVLCGKKSSALIIPQPPVEDAV